MAEDRTEDDYIDSTGHRVYHGSRWHTPKLGDPTKCAVEGCPHPMTPKDPGQRADA